jgi:hypothetical protein
MSQKKPRPNFAVELLTLLLRIRTHQIQISARRPAVTSHVFVVFVSRSRQVRRTCFKLGHDIFLTQLLELVVR